MGIPADEPAALKTEVSRLMRGTCRRTASRPHRGNLASPAAGVAGALVVFDGSVQVGNECACRACAPVGTHLCRRHAVGDGEDAGTSQQGASDRIAHTVAAQRVDRELRIASDQQATGRIMRESGSDTNFGTRRTARYEAG